MILVASTFQRYEESGVGYKSRIASNHFNVWIERPLHGQFMSEASDYVCGKYQWSWLHSGNFTKEMESLIFAAQEQAISTNTIRAHIYSLSCSPKCRFR